MKKITIDLGLFYEDTAKIKELENYIKKAEEIAGDGNEVVLTGKAPVWLYLKIAHALHGKAKKLIYSSPVTGEIVIFDHSPD
ncbi:MAG: CRISPR-associated protein Csx3 [candidate division WOR-3 bacterium]